VLFRSTAIGTWNDWFTPFFFTESTYLQTLPSTLSRLATEVGGTSAVNYPLTIALSLGTTIPPLIIFFIFQRYIIEGIANIGIKG
jgi:multiple sugar transport system permease protein